MDSAAATLRTYDKLAIIMPSVNQTSCSQQICESKSERTTRPNKDVGSNAKDARSRPSRCQEVAKANTS